VNRLHRRQLVVAELCEVFDFFESPTNLESITPPWLRFRIVETSDPEMRLGTRITYRLRLFGMPVRWVSRIAEYERGRCFADEMIVGPYRYWYHRHLFRSTPGGVEIEDLVDYELPFALLGRLAHAVAVGGQLRAIFDYRERRIAEIFAEPGRVPRPGG
jgi:ligand-binding SRPBCC domain-containing protein